MRTLSSIIDWARFAWDYYWPWMTKSSHCDTVDRISRKHDRAIQIERSLWKSAESTAERLSRELSWAHEAMKVAGRVDPVYEMLVQRYMSVEVNKSLMDHFYAVTLRLDERAPYLFGNDDAAAWEFYVETVCRIVRAELLHSKFVQRAAPHTTHPLSREAKS